MQRERDDSCVMNDALKVGTWKRLCLCFLFLLEQTLKETWFYRILSTLGGFITYMHISWYTHGYTYWTLVIVQLLWYFFLKTLTIQVNGCMLIHTMFFSDEDVATFMFTHVFLTKMFCVHTLSVISWDVLSQWCIYRRYLVSKVLKFKWAINSMHTSIFQSSAY